jgi:hypothetical protein
MLLDSFMPISIPLDMNKATPEDIHRHYIQQQAVSDFLDGSLSPMDYLNALELLNVDIDEYMAEVIPLIDEGVTKELYGNIWDSSPFP